MCTFITPNTYTWPTLNLFRPSIYTNITPRQVLSLETKAANIFINSSLLKMFISMIKVTHATQNPRFDYNTIHSFSFRCCLLGRYLKIAL